MKIIDWPLFVISAIFCFVIMLLIYARRDDPVQEVVPAPTPLCARSPDGHPLMSSTQYADRIECFYKQPAGTKFL